MSTPNQFVWEHTNTNAVLEVMADPKKQGAYAQTQSTYLETVNLAKTEEDIQDINDALLAACAKMYKRRQEENGCSHANSTCALISLPKMEERATVARKKPYPYGSPSKPK